MTLYTAIEIRTGFSFQFRDLAALARRITGNERAAFSVEGVEPNPSWYTVVILTPRRLVGWSVVTRVSVPTEAVSPDSAQLQSE